MQPVPVVTTLLLSHVLLQEAEMKECTFQPSITPAPAYLHEEPASGYAARYVEQRLAEVLALKAATHGQEYRWLESGITQNDGAP